MSRLKFFAEINKSSVAEAGGKGASLGELTKAGISVPPGFAVLADAFDRFLEETKLKEEIAARLADVNHEDIGSVENVAKIIRSEVSGIAFTVHPVTEDYDQMIIEAGFGLGEAIVSGQITPDSYVVSKNELSIIDISVSRQTRKLARSGGDSHKKTKPTSEADQTLDSANIWVDLDSSEGEQQKLNQTQIIELAKLCREIENHYGFPCDIEWANAGGKFYITQSRPITTLKPKSA
ncbi:MAG: PEP/pyruvate-binding domain-containing protein [Patescibacteria group bacterium]